MSRWTEERTELAARLYLDGLSASQVAKKLGGVSRNAVIGKLLRLGVKRGAPFVTRPPRPDRPPAPPRAPREPKPPKAAKPRPRPIPEAAGPPPARASEPGLSEHSGTLLQIDPARQCRAVVQDAPRWRMDEAVLCGRPRDPEDDCPYCPGHRAIYWAGAPPAKEARWHAFIARRAA